MAELPLMNEVLIFNCWPPDKIQAVCGEQESGTRLVIPNFFTNLLHIIDAIGFTRTRVFDNLVIRIVFVGLRACLIGDYESIISKTPCRALQFQPWNYLNCRSLWLVQI